MKKHKQLPPQASLKIMIENQLGAVSPPDQLVFYNYKKNSAPASLHIKNASGANLATQLNQPK